MLSFRGLKNLNSASKAFKSDLKWKLLQLPARVYHVYCHLAVRLKIRRPPKKNVFSTCSPKNPTIFRFPMDFLLDRTSEEKISLTIVSVPPSWCKGHRSAPTGFGVFSPQRIICEIRVRRLVGWVWVGRTRGLSLKIKINRNSNWESSFFCKEKIGWKWRNVWNHQLDWRIFQRKNRKILISWKKCL